MRYATLLAVSLATMAGACAHAQLPTASEDTQQRLERIMQQMRADSAAAAAAAAARTAHAEAPPSTDHDSYMPAGIDVSHFELPVQYNERVQQYIDLYAHRRKSVFVSWLRRMGRYREYIETRLSAAGLPRELAYLPVIESGYETTASSSASAVGIWQFMAGTARAEGLEVSDYIDERRDPFRSTEAAIRHLNSLHEMFGSWYLAAAAYNSGSGRISRLLHDYGRGVKGPDETFWEMQDALPTETRGYVPGLLAAVIIGEYPQLFGISVDAAAPLRFETVYVVGATQLRAVAQAAGTSLEEIKLLNPQFVREITPPNRDTQVRVPQGSSAAFAVRLAKIPRAERLHEVNRTHIVGEGETLSEIAAHYGTTVEVLQKVNRIKRPNMVAVGRKLIIPPEGSRRVYGTD